MSDEKFTKEASAIALHCQKALRGRNSRYDAVNKRWERSNIAAFKIQCLFRKWKWTQVTRKRFVKKFIPKKLGKDNCWAKVVENKATREDKMQTWRNVIELRRAFRDSDAELCLKALLASNGDLNKAMPLLGNKEFRFQADYSTPLTEEFKECLNPYVRGFLHNDEEDKGINKGATLIRNKTTSGRRAHRHLAESLLSSNSVEPPLIDLEPIVMQAYFSKNCSKVKKKKKFK
mmetsp:Transcript_8791/g.14979  ORF Transcript_8791/g.14979 Transcript_8791/m.14979 type:complete len:232 (-) Transcript_8791:127-822(-)